MRLVLSAALITLKRSIPAILCALLCLLLAAAVFFAAFERQPPAPARLAIVNQDGSGLMSSMMDSMLESGFEGLLAAESFASAQDAGDCAAVLVIPRGFFESVMTGENIAPQLTVNVSSPIEGAWIGAVAKSASRLLSSAQNVVGALNEAMAADGLPYEERQKLIFSADLELLNDYLTRKGRFESVRLSATGSLTPQRYYLASGVSFLLCVLVFLPFEAVGGLKRFAAFSGRRLQCFAAALLSCALLSLFLTAAAVLLMGGGMEALLSPRLWMAAALLCCVMLFFPSAVGELAGCAALALGLCLIQAVFGGGVLPEALLPPALSAAGGVMPLSLLRRLLADAAFGCGFDGALPALLWCAAAVAVCSVLWLRRGDSR